MNTCICRFFLLKQNSFCEGIINKTYEIKKVEFVGDKVGQFDLQNKIQVTLNNGENLDIKHLRRNFLTNSSCGVCGKTSMDSLEIICKTEINKKGNARNEIKLKRFQSLKLFF